MLSFNDKTYCQSPNCKNECGRQLTQEIIEGARAAKLPISSGYFCGFPKTKAWTCNPGAPEILQEIERIIERLPND